MFSSFFFLHGAWRSIEGIYFSRNGTGRAGQMICYCTILNNPLLQEREQDEFKTRYDNMARIISCP